MFLHLGRDITVNTDSIVAVFDMDTSTGSRHTKAYLRAAEENGSLSVVSDELPKSAVICSENGEQKVYICQISSKTLAKRLENKTDWEIN